MTNNILFGREEVESLTIAGETIYFSVEDSSSMWSVGDDEDESDSYALSELSLYNLQ